MGRHEPKYAFAAAVSILAGRARSVAELKQKLRTKGFSEPAIAGAVTRLKKLGFLDDRRLAEQYASSLARNRAFGRFRVEQELRARRIDSSSVEPALKAAYEETNEQALIDRLLEQRIRCSHPPITRARLYSIYQFLRRRGFRTDDIMKAVKARPELAPVTHDADLDSIEERS